jgi:uncharacterized protein
MAGIRNVLITGASGLIGSRLTELLSSAGYKVIHLSRRKGAAVQTYTWDVEKQVIEPDALKEVDAIIHLAGANVAEKRWTEKRKAELISSRVDSTRLLYNELKKGNHYVKTFISASAVGYYGFENDDEVFTESSPAGSDFLARLTQQWESESNKIASLGIRTVRLRVGVVLSRNDGALKPIAKTVKNLIGAPLGKGTQYISWVHIEDICRMFLHLLQDESLSGAYNGVANEPVTNAELTKAVAKELGKPIIFPNVPAFGLKLAFGEMASIVLRGSKVSNEKIKASGYQMKFPTLKGALADLLH